MTERGWKWEAGTSAREWGMVLPVCAVVGPRRVRALDQCCAGTRTRKPKAGATVRLNSVKED
jgi:hypothetical protein